MITALPTPPSGAERYRARRDAVCSSPARMLPLRGRDDRHLPRHLDVHRADRPAPRSLLGPLPDWERPMKVILTFFLALAATACGGRVVLDDAPTGGQVTGSGGDAGDCDTCYGSLAAGGWPCDGGAGWQAYDGLRQCACSTSSSLCFRGRAAPTSATRSRRSGVQRLPDRLLPGRSEGLHGGLSVKLRLLCISVLALAAVACGGRVVIDASDSDAGSGTGAGGACVTVCNELNVCGAQTPDCPAACAATAQIVAANNCTTGYEGWLDCVQISPATPPCARWERSASTSKATPRSGSSAPAPTAISRRRRRSVRWERPACRTGTASPARCAARTPDPGPASSRGRRASTIWNCGPVPRLPLRYDLPGGLLRGGSMSAAAHLDTLRELAAAGVYQAEAARQCGISPTTAHRLAEQHGFVFKPAPPHPREHFKNAGRKSAESPLHHVFTNDERRAAHRTRRERRR